jgi:hypothetical protein
MAKFRCRRCRTVFSSRRALTQHLRAKHPWDWRLYQLKVYGGGGIALVGLALAFIWFLSGQKVLPPTSFAGPHVETWPDQRISTVPLSIPQQKHIIEHVPGGRRGVFLAYNCVKFACEPGLVEKLMDIALRYPYVYLAPYPKMDAKLALAAQGALLVLEGFDEQKIIEFIEGH